jgi:hypothetical protein
MAVLDMKQRRELKPDDFVFPERGPGSGSYPIPDRDHAEAALRLSVGKPDEHAVRQKVCQKFQIGCPQGTVAAR